MKKYKKIFLVLITLSTMLFFSCGKAEIKNEFGWFTDYEECLKDSKKTGKKMFLLFSRDSADEVSSVLKEKVLYTEEFKTEYSKDYNFCEIDLSPEIFMKAKPEKDAPKEDLKNAKKYEQILEKRMRIFTILSPISTPSLYVLSKDGYVLQDISYIPVETLEQFKEMLKMYSDEIVKIENLIKDVEQKKGTEKVIAIDNLYETGNKKYSYQMTDLMRQVEKLDKKNETGLVGKYLLAIATSDALDAYINRKPEIVPNIYEKLANNSKLTNEQKQQAYFSAFYIIASNTPSEEQVEKMIKLLEKTISIDPDSPMGKQSQKYLDQVIEFKERQEAAEKRKEEESAPVEE